MKKFIKFFMRNKENNLVLPFEQAERVLKSPQQLVMIMEDGQWTGLTINKAEIIMTDRDSNTERHENYNREQLPEPEFRPIDTSKYKPDFLK